MSRFYACALVLTFSACTDNSSGGKDLSANSDGGEDGGANDDLSAVDGSSGDMLTPPDFETHVALRPVPDAVPLKVDGGVDYYELHVKEGQVQVLPGPMTTIWGFDGMWPGPTVHATLGRPVTIRIFNDLPVAESLSIHNHGHNVAAAFDGHPSDNNIPQNMFYDYHYNNLQQGGTDPNYVGAGTYFFHDHEALLTAPHFYQGIEGFYLIHPKAGSTEAGLNLPSGAFDIPLMIQDRAFNPDNSLKYTNNNITGFQGDVLVVNGTPHPFLNVARRRYRFRLLNASNARRIDVGLSSGSMFQIATDGGLLPARVPATKIPMAPAERADIVVDFSQYKIGDIVTLTNDDQFQPVQPELLQFRIQRDESENSTVPVALNLPFVRYTDSVPPTTRTRNLTLDFNAGEWQINGKSYNPTAFEFGDTHLGDVEIWTLTNNNAAQPLPHPFHQHLVEFQILDICPANTTCGTAPPPTQIGWKDTVLVPAATTIRIKMHFYYTGADTATAFQTPAPYVFHCHNLEHEDHAMMLQQQVSQ